MPASRAKPAWQLGGTLTLRDTEMFSRLGISADLVEQSHIERVTDQEARGKYGIVGYGDMSGIVFPYIDPSNARHWTARVRRDNPEMENGKCKHKYISAYGDRRHLFFPPGSAELLSNRDVPIIFVEAEKSALALLAWTERMGRKVLPIGMGGCWGWRGRIGTVGNSHGERVDEVGPLSDLRCASDGRVAIVLLDSNINSEPKVQLARAALVRQLVKQGADVLTADLPALEGVNGPDDYIGQHGDEAMAQLLNTTRRPDTTKNLGIPEAEPSGRNLQLERKETQTQRLLRLADGVELFHDSDVKPFARIDVNGHLENWPLKSEEFRRWLLRQYYLETKSAPRSQALKEAVNTLSSRAQFEGAKHDVHLRLAGSLSKAKIYLDLASDDWRLVEIDTAGWRILDNAPVRFRRAYGNRPLPKPISGGQLDELKRFINISSDDDWMLTVC